MEVIASYLVVAFVAANLDWFIDKVKSLFKNKEEVVPVVAKKASSKKKVAAKAKK